MSKSYEIKLSKNERVFDVRPIGIRYQCQHCHMGFMVASDIDPFIFKNGKPISRVHYCDNCGARMELPKTYPYIEWVPSSDNVKINYETEEAKEINYETT